MHTTHLEKSKKVIFGFIFVVTVTITKPFSVIKILFIFKITTVPGNDDAKVYLLRVLY